MYEARRGYPAEALLHPQQEWETATRSRATYLSLKPGHHLSLILQEAFSGCDV